MIRPEIRFATLEDAPAILDIIRQAEMGEHHIVNGSVDDLLLENVFVALHHEVITGFVFWVHGRRYAYIDTMAVLPQYQKHGIGAWLILALNNYLSTLGIKHVYAATSPSKGGVVRGMLSRIGYETLGSVVSLHKNLAGGGLNGTK